MLIKSSHPIFLNLSLAGERKRSFYLQLNGQAVGIPPRLPRYMIALQCLITANGILV
jgi:hypothetical protein